MTKKEKAKIEAEIKTRKDNLNTIRDTFGYDSTEVFIVKSEISLLENILNQTKPEKPRRKYKQRKDKGKTRTNNNSQKVMYINKEGDLFVQIRENGEYVKTVGRLVYVNCFDYLIYGLLDKVTLSGIVLKNWRIEHK